MRMLIRLFYEYHASSTLVLHPFTSATFSKIHHNWHHMTRINKAWSAGNTLYISDTVAAKHDLSASDLCLYISN